MIFLFLDNIIELIELIYDGDTTATIGEFSRFDYPDVATGFDTGVLGLVFRVFAMSLFYFTNLFSSPFKLFQK
jgi:hypothetical protein